MVKLVSKIISKIKHREYIIDENITDNDLFSIVFTRFFMLIRGFFATIGFKKRGKISFIGKKVCIKSKSHIECGSGLTINDNCTINALCKGGIKIGNNFSLGQNSIIECTGVIDSRAVGLAFGVPQPSVVEVERAAVVHGVGRRTAGAMDIPLDRGALRQGEGHAAVNGNDVIRGLIKSKLSDIMAI